MLRLVVGLGPVVLGMSVMGCAEPVGEPIGTYSVTYSLVDNGCGTGAVYTLDGEVFGVELRHEDERGWWRPADGMPMQGLYRDGEYAFALEKLVQLVPPEPDPDFGHPGCRVIQSELLSGNVLDDGLTGEHVMTLVPTGDSSCDLVMTGAGGPFQQLPCEIRYAYEGEPRDDF